MSEKEKINNDEVKPVEVVEVKLDPVEEVKPVEEKEDVIVEPPKQKKKREMTPERKKALLENMAQVQPKVINKPVEKVIYSTHMGSIWDRFK